MNTMTTIFAVLYKSMSDKEKHVNKNYLVSSLAKLLSYHKSKKVFLQIQIQILYTPILYLITYIHVQDPKRSRT